MTLISRGQPHIRVRVIGAARLAWLEEQRGEYDAADSHYAIARKAITNSPCRKPSGETLSEMDTDLAIFDHSVKVAIHLGEKDNSKYRQAMYIADAVKARTVREQLQTNTGFGEQCPFLPTLDQQVLQEPWWDQLGKGTIVLYYHALVGEYLCALLGAEGVLTTPSMIPEDKIYDAGLEFGVALLELTEGRTTARRQQFIQLLSDLRKTVMPGPVQEYLWDHPIERLIVVPDRVLHSFPLHLLLNEQRYLIDLPTRGLLYTPSVRMFTHCTRAAKTREQPRRFVAFANPTCDLPSAASEVRKIGTLFEEARIFSEAQATADAFINNAGDANVLWYAGHSEFIPNRPHQSYLAFRDRNVTVQELLDSQLRLAQCSLFVLNSCESGQAKETPGRQLASFGVAFLGLGAASVLGNPWRVSDTAAAQLMLRFCQEWLQGKQSAAEALQHAISHVRRLYGDDPYLWGAPILIGAAND